MCLVTLVQLNFCDVKYPSDKPPRLYAFGAEKKTREEASTEHCRGRGVAAGPGKIPSFLTTTAGEDKTSEDNPENNKRDAVDVAPSVVLPAHENEATAEPTTAEPAQRYVHGPVT